MRENRLMQEDLYAENERLKAIIEELESKHHIECGQIAQYSDENAKLKELLKEVLIIVKTRPFCDEHYCNICKNVGCEWGEDCFEWEHIDEALALIGEEGEQNE